MKLLSHQSLLTLLSGLSLVMGSLSAEEADLSIEDMPLADEHVAVRSRKMDSQKREAMDQRRASESEQDKQSGEEPPLLQKAALISSNDYPQFRLAPALMEKPKFQLSSSYSFNNHYLANVDDLGRTLEIEDGSHWDVIPSDQYVLNYWRRSDTLVITPNYDWFSSGDYYITNKSNNSYVRANLYIGPKAFGQYSHWIVAIDHMSGHLTLENGMTWCICSKDNYIFREWEANDHLIIGMYDNWFHSYDHILINVNMDSHVRAKLY